MLKRIEVLLQDIQKYLTTRGELIRINAVEKSSRLLMWIFFSIIALLVGLFALAFIAVAITILLAKVLPLWAACLIIAAIFLILLVVIFLSRNSILLNPIIRRMSDIIYPEDEDEKEEDNL